MAQRIHALSFIPGVYSQVQTLLASCLVSCSLSAPDTRDPPVPFICRPWECPCTQCSALAVKEKEGQPTFMDLALVGLLLFVPILNPVICSIDTTSKRCLGCSKSHYCCPGLSHHNISVGFYYGLLTISLLLSVGSYD